MAAGTKTPPRRGVPFYDAELGRMRILPREGGKVVDYIGSPPPPFSARRALKRAGIRAGGAAVRAGDRAAASAPKATVRALERSGTLPDFGTSPYGLGGLLLYAFGTLIGLALLDAALGGRGPAAVSKGLDLLGGGIRKLVDPTDPLVPRGELPAATSADSPASAGSTTKTTATVTRPHVTLDKVRFTGASLEGTDRGFLRNVAIAAANAGATIVDVASARRTPTQNRAVGGVPDSNHLDGHALDGRAFIPGRGWIPLGHLPGLAPLGLRSGDQPGFFRGARDPSHIDDGTNVKGGK